MDKNELAEILEKHKKWLRNEVDGERAILHNVSLHNADLRGADLSCADLRGAYLRGADLCGSNLRYADLRGADLCGADLYGADLCCADLCGADLRGVDLCGSNLHSVDLNGANLHYTKLDTKIAEKFFPLCCPEVGEFIGWKKVAGDYIVKLKITEDAKRSSAYGRKCRCSKAEVLAIENIDGTKANVDTVFSGYDTSFKYKVGEIVEPKLLFDKNRFNECASGIHFFITRQEAVDYLL